MVLGLLLGSNTVSTKEIYYACTTKMVEDKGTDKFVPEGEVFGFQYFMLDTKKSKITVHEQMGDEKPDKIGTKKVEFVGKNSVEFEFKNSEGSIKMVDSFYLKSGNNFSEQGYKSFSFDASTYIKDGSTLYDYDYRSGVCIGPVKDGKILEPKKAKKLYKKWIKRGY